MAIGFPIGATLSVTEGITTTVHVCPQILEGILDRQISVNATTSDISARGKPINVIMYTDNIRLKSIIINYESILL